MISTQNETWGFWGTSSNDYSLSREDADALFVHAVNLVSKSINGSNNKELARDFLDAADGRHLSDAISWKLKGKALSALKKAFTATWTEDELWRMGLRRYLINNDNSDSWKASDINKHLEKIQWTRKPMNFEEIGQIGFKFLTNVDFAEFVASLSSYPCKDISRDKFPVDASFFLIKTDKQLFLVDNQGYDYARYAVELPFDYILTARKMVRKATKVIK